jgi:hypothetical protein
MVLSKPITKSENIIIKHLNSEFICHSNSRHHIKSHKSTISIRYLWKMYRSNLKVYLRARDVAQWWSTCLETLL